MTFDVCMSCERGLLNVCVLPLTITYVTQVHILTGTTISLMSWE